MTRTYSLWAAFFLLPVLTLQATGQPAAPPPPKEYAVQVRYRIPSTRNQRLVQYFALVDFLKKHGFQKDPGPDTEPEDPSANVMTGTATPAKAYSLLGDARVQSLLLMPAGYTPPEDGNQPVKVRLELASGWPLDRQRVFHDQVAERLALLGFREAIAYDHRSFTRMVGTIPASELFTLLQDLRQQPAGWLLPVTPLADLPAPLRNTSPPVLVTEVLPDPEGVPPAKDLAAVEVPPELQDLSPDLRDLLGMEGESAKPRRLDVLLAVTPADDDDSWRQLLSAAAPGLVIEGRLGQLVSVLTTPGRAPALAALPIVSSVRLPRSGAPQDRPLVRGADGNPRALDATGLARLHSLGHGGKGVRVAIVDGDFRGWREQLGKGLPAGTRYLDLTMPRNPTMEPDPFPGDPKELGHGTVTAMTAARAAPEAELTLIRIDPEAPYMLQTVARALNGSPLRSETLDSRGDQLSREYTDLQQQRYQLLQERKVILSNFNQDEASLQKRQEYLKKQAAHDAAEKDYQRRLDRYTQLRTDLTGLRGIRVAASSLVWNEGHPTDGSSPLSRYFDDRPFKATFWVQAAGDTRGQAWTGPFRDADGNGVMEFAPAGARLKPGRWTPELDFLGWQPFDGEPTADLPAQARVRIAIQWREPHDPEFARFGEDVYRDPLATLRLVVLRQRDPSGKQLSADDMEVVAISTGRPQRLQNLPNSATYEQSVEFTVETPGRYALRIEGRKPDGIRPPGMPDLPILTKFWELRPRVFVNVLDGPSRAAGRPVWLDHVTEAGTVGMPADASSVITVGAAGPSGQARPYSAGGPPWNLALLTKPNAVAFDGLPVGTDDALAGLGTGPAAGLAAGITATAIGAGMPRIHLLRTLEEGPGRLLNVPEGWSTQR